MPFPFRLTPILALLVASGAVHAQDSTLRASVDRALRTNPDVTARLNAYRASADAVGVASAAYLPRLDLSASAGRESDRYSNTNPEIQNFARSEAGMTLAQRLWDGMATRNDVQRSEHERDARYFEWKDVSESTALEAARAHFDVQRYRRLVQLAEDNYVQHRYAYLRIQSRFRSGVGRGVDLEQAGARIALAESNLTTEIANLHDVVARYQRIVGAAPAANLPPLELLRDGIPASAAEAMQLATQRSAAVSASIESLRAARSLVGGRRSALQPQIDARLSGTVGRNVGGNLDQTRSSSAQLVLSWNLFNGGADHARLRQQTNLLTQAADLRDKTCRDTQQTAAIAFNDTRKQIDQLTYLERNTLAIEKARDAYRQQFDIGQRGLLDVLNAENELYTARRSYANAEYDLGYAYARTHAAMNQLGARLELSQSEPPPRADGWSADDDAPTRCPVIVAQVTATERSELDARAQQLLDSAPPASAAVPPIRR